MRVETFPLSQPSLEELADKLTAPLAANFEESSVTVVPCPDLRQAPFHLATEGLSGDEKVADVGGQPNLFPRPRLDCRWSLLDLAKGMGMSPEGGSLIGAGAGPFHVIGQNCELCPNLSWEGDFDHVENSTYFMEVDQGTGQPNVKKSPSLDCGLMVNLFGSSGHPGNVLKITGWNRKGSEKSFTECIRKGLSAAYGDNQTISLGGAFIVKSGKVRYHIMPDFPKQPFKGRGEVEKWLTYHDFDEPVVCLSVLHSADPGDRMGLRIEHTHGFSATGANCGGHYHYDLDGDDGQVVEYEGYFNIAKVLYRIDRPETRLEQE